MTPSAAPPVFEATPCTGCGAAGGEVVLRSGDRLHGGPGVFNVVRCPECGLMRTDPRPSRASMAAYYPADYLPYVQTSALPGRFRATVRRLLAGDDTRIPPIRPGKLLEVGTASGNFLVEMQQAGWFVEGLEWDVESAERAAARTGARVVAGDVAGVSLPAGAYDLVCAWMVLEHLEDPRAAIARFLAWLRPGGWLAFSVPDCGGWQFRVFRANWHALQLPTHLHHFTAPLLEAWLRAAGFDSIAVHWQANLFDVPMSCAYAVESSFGPRIGRLARAAAGSFPSRILSRSVARPAAALRLTGRLTVWARKP